MPEPFFKSLHLARQFTDADSAVADHPGDQPNRQTCTQTEDNRHQPVPTARKGQRDINHRQEIDQSMRAESDRKEYTQDEGPYPALFAVRLFEPFADAVLVLVVMMTAEKQHYAADQHKAC